MNYMSININGIGDERKSRWIKGLKKEHDIQFLSIQETKLVNSSSYQVSKFWGPTEFKYDYVNAAGRSGGIMCIWDPKLFCRLSVIKDQNFLVVSGSIADRSELFNMVNVYSPQSLSEKQILWENLVNIRNSSPGVWVFMGDFNEVRSEEERHNSIFIPNNAIAFNNFIFNENLVEYVMGGRWFTYLKENGMKFGKIDTFLVCLDFMNEWPDARLTALDRIESDHCPLILITKGNKFGPYPFRFYNSWMSKDGFMEVVEKALNTSIPVLPPVKRLAQKLKNLKSEIRSWLATLKDKEEATSKQLKPIIKNLEEKA
ncbi:uncharacterized protein LOC143628884 [Bidens hawaiensis]|uniref:uncharacterized protein LOC143628884 n=1 Tax=Bidens hawaiensis TaxID=980011 RepID=UPI00404A8094